MDGYVPNQDIEIKFTGIQPGDMLETYANIDSLAEQANFRPTTTIQEGIQAFVDWYRDYYKK